MSDLTWQMALVPVALAAGAIFALHLARWRMDLRIQRERRRLERLYTGDEFERALRRLTRQRSLQVDLAAREAARKAAEIRWLEHEAERRSLSELASRLRRRSLSQLMVHGAVSRLPVEMDEREKSRWEEEMVADVAAIGSRWQRLRYAFGILRRGASKMPAGGAGVPRSVD